MNRASLRVEVSCGRCTTAIAVGRMILGPGLILSGLHLRLDDEICDPVLGTLELGASEDAWSWDRYDGWLCESCSPSTGPPVGVAPESEETDLYRGEDPRSAHKLRSHKERGPKDFPVVVGLLRELGSLVDLAVARLEKGKGNDGD